MADEGGMALILTTVAGRGDAVTLARGLLVARLAACVQFTPIESLYVWQGEIREEAEFRLLIKCRRRQREKIMTWLLQNSPYDNPQIIYLDVDDVAAPYLDWLYSVTDREDEPPG